MRCDFAVAMEDVHRLAPSLYLDPLADKPERHGIAVRRQTDQIIVGHDPRDPRLLLEAALARQWHEVPAFSLKPCARQLVGRAVQAPIGDGRVPFVELGLEARYAVLSDGTVWVWEYSASSYASLIVLLAGPVVGLALGLIVVGVLVAANMARRRRAAGSGLG